MRRIFKSNYNFKTRIVLAGMLTVAFFGSYSCETYSDKNAPGSHHISADNDVEVYQNSYFGMTIMLPKNWHAKDQRTMKELVKEANKMQAGGDTEFHEALKEGAARSIFLFSISKYPFGSTNMNPSISCAVEPNIEHPYMTGSEYVSNLRGFLKQSAIPWEFSSEPYKTTLGGKTFDTFDAFVTSDQGILYQTYYFSIIKGYVLGFVTTWFTKKEAQQLQGILDTVQFQDVQ